MLRVITKGLPEYFAACKETLPVQSMHPGFTGMHALNGPISGLHLEPIGFSICHSHGSGYPFFSRPYGHRLYESGTFSSVLQSAQMYTFKVLF
jgi:hypothetical protein